MIAKPAYGSPCNNCGLCCQNEVCPLGQLVFTTAQAPCPALEIGGEGGKCGLIAHPERYAPIRTAVYGAEAMRDAAAFGVGAGIGCDARTEDERNAVPPPEFARAMAAVKRLSSAARNKIMRLWSNPR